MTTHRIGKEQSLHSRMSKTHTISKKCLRFYEIRLVSISSGGKQPESRLIEKKYTRTSKNKKGCKCKEEGSRSSKQNNGCCAHNARNRSTTLSFRNGESAKRARKKEVDLELSLNLPGRTLAPLEKRASEEIPRYTAYERIKKLVVTHCESE